MTARRWMLVRGALGIAMSMFVLAVLAARPASAQDAGIAERADTTWDVRPDAGEVHLTIEVTLTNTTDDTPTTRTFWSSWGVALPFEPDSVTVRRGDTVLDHDLSSLDDGTPTVSWDFPDDLGADDQQTFVIDVTVASAPPRSTWEDGPRVDPAFVAVPIWAWGRDDADLRVRVPHAMGARLGPDEPTGRDGSVDVWELDVDGPTFAEVLVGSSDTGEVVDETVEIEGATVTIRSWPGDPEWGEQIAEFARAALPLIGDWTATPWHGDGLTIVETATPFTEGWGGWNDPDTATISVGEEYDRVVWTHELAHTWFGPDEFSETWLAEGLSEYVTAQLADELGIDDPPAPAPGNRALSEWGDVVADAARTRLNDPEQWDETVGKLYDGAHHVVATVADEVGPDAFREMVRMTLADESSWSGPGEVGVPPTAGWREFLTLAERVGGSTEARDLVLEHVDPTAEPALDRRDAALAAYAALEGDEWAPPLEVRQSLQEWAFDEAEADIARALDLRTDLATTTSRATELGLGMPDLRSDWEVGTLSSFAAGLAAVDEVLGQVEALRRAATDAGLPVPPLLADPAEDGLPAVSQRLDALNTAIRQVVEARDRLAEVRADGLARVGLLGSTPDLLYEDATAALAAGDTQQVATATGALLRLLDDAGTRGRTRLWLAVVALVLVAVALVLGWRWWRRQPRRPAHGDEVTTSGPSRGPAPAPRTAAPPRTPAPPRTGTSPRGAPPQEEDLFGQHDRPRARR